MPQRKKLLEVNLLDLRRPLHVELTFTKFHAILSLSLTIEIATGFSFVVLILPMPFLGLRITLLKLLRISQFKTFNATSPLCLQNKIKKVLYSK